MKATTVLFWDAEGWKAPESGWQEAQWILYFGSRKALAASAIAGRLQDLAPHAIAMGGSTGGEILGDEVLEDTVVGIVVSFSSTQVRSAKAFVKDMTESSMAGKTLANQLAAPDLTAVFLLSDGLNVDGSELIRGLYEVLPSTVTVTGGFAGDGDAFRETEVGLESVILSHHVAAVGFYGNSLKVGHGSAGVWSPFGPGREITRAEGNVIYELDGVPALDVYKKYLGEEAAHLPQSALHFPLVVRPKGAPVEEGVVRTFLQMDETTKSLIFSGDVPQGAIATMMHGDTNHLLDGAEQAAQKAFSGGADLAILVSCMGRKLLMGQRVFEEAEAVAHVLGKTPTLGFYSYGEICPHQVTQKCSFHNQTMTITTFKES